MSSSTQIFSEVDVSKLAMYKNVAFVEFGFTQEWFMHTLLYVVLAWWNKQVGVLGNGMSMS